MKFFNKMIKFFIIAFILYYLATGFLPILVRML